MEDSRRRRMGRLRADPLLGRLTGRIGELVSSGLITVKKGVMSYWLGERSRSGQDPREVGDGGMQLQAPRRSARSTFPDYLRHQEREMHHRRMRLPGVRQEPELSGRQLIIRQRAPAQRSRSLLTKWPSLSQSCLLFEAAPTRGRAVPRSSPRFPPPGTPRR
jgi:hypothetical protein